PDVTARVSSNLFAALATRVSVKVMAVAVSVPVLVTVTVQVTSSPTFGGALSLDLLMAKSAAGAAGPVACTTTTAELLVGVVSLSDETTAVLVIVPGALAVITACRNRLSPGGMGPSPAPLQRICFWSGVSVQSSGSGLAVKNPGPVRVSVTNGLMVPPGPVRVTVMSNASLPFDGKVDDSAVLVTEMSAGPRG